MAEIINFLENGVQGGVGFQSNIIQVVSHCQVFCFSRNQIKKCK